MQGLMKIVKLGTLCHGAKFRTLSPSGMIGNEYRVLCLVPNRGALVEYVNQTEERRIIPLERDVLIYA